MVVVAVHPALADGDDLAVGLGRRLEHRRQGEVGRQGEGIRAAVTSTEGGVERAVRQVAQEGAAAGQRQYLAPLVEHDGERVEPRRQELANHAVRAERQVGDLVGVDPLERRRVRLARVRERQTHDRRARRRGDELRPDVPVRPVGHRVRLAGGDQAFGRDDHDRHHNQHEKTPSVTSSGRLSLLAAEPSCA